MKECPHKECVRCLVKCTMLVQMTRYAEIIMTTAHCCTNYGTTCSLTRAVSASCKDTECVMRYCNPNFGFSGSNSSNSSEWTSPELASHGRMSYHHQSPISQATQHSSLSAERSHVLLHVYSTRHCNHSAEHTRGKHRKSGDASTHATWIVGNFTRTYVLNNPTVVVSVCAL
jgi:hypothetical protein